MRRSRKPLPLHDFRLPLALADTHEYNHAYHGNGDRHDDLPVKRLTIDGLHRVIDHLAAPHEATKNQDISDDIHIITSLVQVRAKVFVETHRITMTAGTLPISGNTFDHQRSRIIPGYCEV